MSDSWSVATYQNIKNQLVGGPKGLQLPNAELSKSDSSLQTRAQEQTLSPGLGHQHTKKA